MYKRQELGQYLGRAGIQVISGMARGIDGISQQAALSAGGTSYGVLGCGVDICYPAQNRRSVSYTHLPVDILHLQKTKTEKSSEDMKRQIRHARERQAERFAGTDCRFNGDIRSAQVEEYCPLGEEGQKVMEQLYRTLQLSARVYHRILKTARTIADLEDREEITGEHLLEAACYRPSETYWN